MVLGWVIYGLIALVLMLLILIPREKSSRIARHGLLLLAVSLLVFVGAFRFEVGVDYNSYEYLIVRAINGYATHFEHGFLWLIYVAHSILDSSSFVVSIVFFVCSLASIALLYGHIRDFSCDEFFSLALYALIPIYYLATFNAVRNSLAIAIFAFSLRFVRDRRLLWYMVSVGCASLVHKSALLMFPFYWLLNYSPRLDRYFFMALLILSLLHMYLPFISFIGFSETYLSYSSAPGSLNFKAIFFVLLFFLMYFLLSSYGLHYAWRVHLNLAFWGVLVVLGSFSVKGIDSALFYRLSGFFTLSILVLTPVVMRHVFPSRVSYYYARLFVVFCALGSYFYVLIYLGEHYRLLPYAFVIYH